jgi:cellulose 1,4-beta-cellobiosidase
MGTCCNEMDIWEANSISAAVTPHPCTVSGQTMCSGTNCSAAGTTAGVCDQAGCDFNSYRMGVTNFYGPGMTVDTKSKITVVTQFVTADNTTTGTLSAIRRIYVQNGKVIQNSMSNIPGVDTTNEITTDFCTQQKTAFGDTNTFQQKGGLSAMGKALENMVLVLSLWDDHTANMLWLDSDYPVNASASSPGVARGSCSPSSGAPTDIESNAPNSQVVFSNIKFGPIGSTYTGSTTTTTGTGTGTATGPTGTGTGTATGSAPAATQTKYGQW